MENEYEYKFINIFTTPSKKLCTPNYSKDDEQKALNYHLDKAIKEISSKLATNDGGNWIIVSHDIAQLKGSILLSVLVQRMKL